jgi:Zn-dependent M28 family amino/carboxypeptidase
VSIADQESAERLHTHVDRLAGLIGPRHLGLPTSLDAAAALIQREFENLGDRVERQVYRVNGLDATNLIVERRGTRYPQEIAILGAHYDTVPGTPGADDNASAVAAMLEVARLLQQHPIERTLRFVAFTCEEPPYFYTDSMGSQVYARRCRQRGENIVGMLCLEMIGYYSTEPDSQLMPPKIPRFLRPAFPKRGDFLAAVGNLRSISLGWAFRRGFKRAVRFPLYSISLPEAVNEIRLSDNSSFWDQGYPALMLTDTSFLRNPHYHADTDTPNTLDYARMARATLGIAGGVARLAKSAKQVSRR